MRTQIIGKIISTQIGIFGPNEVKYGYITIQSEDSASINVKIDAYTMYETLKIGDQVVIGTESLGDTDILVARKIILAEGEISHQADTAEERHASFAQERPPGPAGQYRPDPQAAAGGSTAGDSRDNGRTPQVQGRGRMCKGHSLSRDKGKYKGRDAPYRPGVQVHAIFL